MAREIHCKACGHAHDPMKPCPRAVVLTAAQRAKMELATREAVADADAIIAAEPPKFDRAKYQREYMREQRKKDRKEADKLGITVAEYRFRRSEGKL